MLSTIVSLSLSLNLVYGLYPSSRIVYYLHTTPASWASARDTCARYGGHLVNVKNSALVDADVDTLNRWLQWKDAFSGVTSNLWTGLHRFTDPNSNTDTVLWHPCQRFTNATYPNGDIAKQLLESPHYCTSADYAFTLSPTPCDIKLPYICQIDEGQCYFLPLEKNAFKNTPAVTSNGDLNTCARSCRNDIDKSGAECWGFMVKEGTCMMYRSTKRHAFIKSPGSYLTPNENMTSYFKICTGGEATAMKPVTDDNSVKPEHANCSVTDGSAEIWDNGVCYCDCDQPPVILDPEYLALPIDVKVSNIVRELTVNADNTSANYRKLNSINDERPSAKSIGAAGIIILAAVFGGLVLLDFDVLVTHVWQAFCRGEGVKKDDNGENVLTSP
ncbi:unnamed protein product [Candidula unifasciata]|uniref:C-type lectin domain-containing protein n=1 Tax=Candidula unifasciata TaxID=100452 RepID=A0A8S3YM31_9EUPU|nr:unnamed protein product [Candidula unifasciata]